MDTSKPGRWVLDSAQGGISSLHYNASYPAPTAADLGPEYDVVEMRAALAKSINAVRLDGLITTAGFIAGNSDTPAPEVVNALWRLYMMRGMLFGTWGMFKDMVAWLGERGVKPAVDDGVFSLEDATKAYERLERQEHFSEVIIRIA